MERKTKNSIFKIVSVAMLAAIVCVATLVSVSLPHGYANIGDIGVLVSGFLLGPVWGGLAAGIGSGLADLFAGYPMYIPGTFVIKFAVAVIASLIYKALASERRGKLNIPARVAAVIPAESAMVSGYFLYEAFVLSYGVGGAFASLFGNTMQGLICAAGAVALSPIVEKIYFKIYHK